MSAKLPKQNYSPKILKKMPKKSIEQHLADIKAGKYKNRGFGGMDPEKHRAIAAKGGRAAHERGVAHQFTKEEARLAGMKGGATVSKDRGHMISIGRMGGRGKKK